HRPVRLAPRPQRRHGAVRLAKAFGPACAGPNTGVPSLGPGVFRVTGSEPETDTGGAGEGVLVQEAGSEPVLDLGVEGAEVPAQALGELVVEDDGAGVLGARAGRVDIAAAAGEGTGGEGILLVAVVGGGDVELLVDRELHPGPEHLQDLRVGEGGV